MEEPTFKIRTRLSNTAVGWNQEPSGIILLNRRAVGMTPNKATKISLELWTPLTVCLETSLVAIDGIRTRPKTITFLSLPEMRTTKKI